MKEDGLETGPNEVGELLIKGKHPFKCYWNNQGATEETVSAGWLYTGDLAKRDQMGTIILWAEKKI